MNTIKLLLTDRFTGEWTQCSDEWEPRTDGGTIVDVIPPDGLDGEALLEAMLPTIEKSIAVAPEALRDSLFEIAVPLYGYPEMLCSVRIEGGVVVATQVVR